MGHSDDEIKAIIDSAMTLHRERGNVELSDEARAEIHGWLQDEKISAGRTDAQLAKGIANALGRAQRFQSPGPGGSIPGEPLKQALYICDQGLDHRDPWG
jgi:hypothetical protein